jgi:hypothetical protein
MAKTVKNDKPAAPGNGGQGKTESAQVGPRSVNESDKSVQSTVGLEVSSMQDGYRRCGRAWTRDPQIVPLDDFDEAQVAILRNDPGLRVFAVQLPTAGEAE